MCLISHHPTDNIFYVDGFTNFSLPLHSISTYSLWPCIPTHSTSSGPRPKHWVDWSSCLPWVHMHLLLASAYWSLVLTFVHWSGLLVSMYWSLHPAIAYWRLLWRSVHWSLHQGRVLKLTDSWCTVEQCVAITPNSDWWRKKKQVFTNHSTQRLSLVNHLSINYGPFSLLPSASKLHLPAYSFSDVKHHSRFLHYNGTMSFSIPSSLPNTSHLGN